MQAADLYFVKNINGNGHSGDDKPGNASRAITVMQPPQTYQYQTSLIDIITGTPISGATIGALGKSATTDASGNATLTTTQELKPTDQLIISATGYQTYTTYSKYSTEQGKQSYKLIPLQYLDEINQIARTGINGQNYGTRKWDLSLTPKFIINTTNFSPEAIASIEDVLRNDVELLTDGKVKMQRI